MSLCYSRVSWPKNNPRFCVTVAWEHGDADHTSYNTTQFKGMSEPEFLEWLKSFREMAGEISTARDGGKWQGVEHWERLLKLSVQWDAIFDVSLPAQPSIDKVEYVDWDDKRFAVTGY